MGELIDVIMFYTAGRCIRYYPLRDRLRLSHRALILFCIAECAISCGFLLFLRPHFAPGIAGLQIYKILFGCVVQATPFILTRHSFFQSLFLLSISMNYFFAVHGCANYLEAVYGGAFAARYPYVICNAVVVLLFILLIPMLLKRLNRLFRDWSVLGSDIWRFIWMVPTLFVCYSMLGGTITGDADSVPPSFVIARMLSFCGLFVTYSTMNYILRRESENATFRENVRMMDIELAAQRQQYERVAMESSRLIALRHDMRHLVTALGGFLAEGDVRGARRYCADIAGSIAGGAERRYCRNFALNALVAHYVDRAERAGVSAAIELDVPERAGRIKDDDLCAIAANMLENAIEACARMGAAEEKFISLRSRADEGTLTLVMSNSYGGDLKPSGDTYLSNKRDGEGVGLSSIRAIAERCGGALKCEARDGVFLTSVYLVTAMSPQGDLC